MRKLIFCTSVFLTALMLCATSASAQARYKYIEASELTIFGKLMPTPNPYHRVDTMKYKGFTRDENFQVRMSSGMGVTFRTNSTAIVVLTEYGQLLYPTNTNGISARGYDLYIKDARGKWLYASSNVRPDNTLYKPLELLTGMDGSEKECLLYFPLYSEESSIKIGVDEGATIEALDNPFRHRVAIWGSSYTHGSSTSRAGMTYPAQFCRATGVQLLSLGCSGNCKLQDYFADVLVDVEADAFVFDAFSNPQPWMIEERLMPFIEKMTRAHPGKPLIFQRTIRRENGNFSQLRFKEEADKFAKADSLMAMAVKKYPDVYYIRPDATSPTHEATVDGTHPDNYGYTLWAKSIEKPIMKILRKYGLR